MSALTGILPGVGSVVPLVSFVSEAAAHKLKFTLTEMVWIPDSHSLEVTHALHLDDALPLLALLGDPAGKLDVPTQARLLAYTETHFQLQLEGQPLSLEAVGAQIDGDYLWIYQEQKLAHYPQRLRVGCTLLHELYGEQENQVNLQVGDEVRTHRFNHRNNQATF